MGEKEWEYKHGKFMRNSPPILGIIVCRDNIPHGEIAEILNAQSSEIAGLRDLLRDILDCYDEVLTEYTQKRIADALRGAVPNPSEIPNSSEVPDAAEGG